MHIYKRRKKIQEYPSFYDAFELGDRVKRIYKDINGSHLELKGIVLAIDANSIEIYWDTKDGKYKPTDWNIGFTNCPIDEIFSGNKDILLLRKIIDIIKYIFVNILKVIN